MADDFAAVNVSLQLAVAELVVVSWPLKSVAARRELNPVTPNHFMVNHEAQSKEHIALIRCKGAGHVQCFYVDALLKDAYTEENKAWSDTTEHSNWSLKLVMAVAVSKVGMPFSIIPAGSMTEDSTLS